MTGLKDLVAAEGLSFGALRSQAAFLPDGRRLHLQDGPIDLVIEASGDEQSVRAAYRAAVSRFHSILDELCAEIEELRKPADPIRTNLRGVIARRMHAAVAPLAREKFITPMAAVAGAVAEEVLNVMTGSATLERAYVNNGGDIAYYLIPGQFYSVGVIDRPDHNTLFGRVRITSQSEVRGVATSGRHGRSFSLGIADAVTVFARTASEADAAATIVANSVDLPDMPEIHRLPACNIDPNSDLGDRLVVRSVPNLSHEDVQLALDRGEATAKAIAGCGLIEGAILRLQGAMRICGMAREIANQRAATVVKSNQLN